MNSKLQIFISSTYTDLLAERQAAVKAILKAGHIPAGMELFTAGDQSQWTVIQKWISDCDIYMLIIGGRYGSIEQISGLSYTELEYDYAVKCGKPHFAVVINDEELNRRQESLGSRAIEQDNPDKLKSFRSKVLSKISAFFSEPKDVELAVLETVPGLAEKYSLQGWVRSEATPTILSSTDGVTIILRKQWLPMTSRSTMVESRGDTAIYSEPDWRIMGFHVEGRNETGRKIRKVSGHLQFIESNHQIDILLDGFNPEQTYGIPAEASFSIRAIFPRSTPDIEGITFEQFWRDFGPFNLHLNFDNIYIQRHFTTAEISLCIQDTVASLPKRSTGNPRV
jgi:hypothetical protein